MNNDLPPDWTPGAGKIYTWYAMDKNGRIGVFVNNCWGGYLGVYFFQKMLVICWLTFLNTYMKSLRFLIHILKIKMGVIQLICFLHG